MRLGPRVWLGFDDLAMAVRYEVGPVDKNKRSRIPERVTTSEIDAALDACWAGYDN